MKNTKKAFTLVELIVVITILAVLATVAFISLTGHAQDAKNSKVASDLRTMASAIETKATKDGLLANSLPTGSTFDNNSMANNTNRYKSGATLEDGNYAIGSVDFGVLGQNGDDFKSPDEKDYIIGAVGSKYQLAGEIYEDDSYKVIIKGNYVKGTGANVVDGLISEKVADYTAVTSTTNSGTTVLY